MRQIRAVDVDVGYRQDLFADSDQDGDVRDTISAKGTRLLTVAGQFVHRERRRIVGQTEKPSRVRAGESWSGREDKRVGRMFEGKKGWRMC